MSFFKKSQAFFGQELHKFKFKYFPFSVRPISASLLLTTRCNGRCRMCKLWEVSPPVDMPFQKLKEALLDLRGFGISHITVLGGEPFLYRELYELADFVKKNFLSLGIVTNGSLIDEKNIDRVKKYFDYVETSLDADNEDLFSRIRMGYSFNKVIRALELLSSHKVPRGVTFLVQKDNVGHIEKTHRLSEKLDTRFQLSFVRTAKHGVTGDKDFGVVDTGIFEKEFESIKPSKFLTTSERGFRLLLDRLNGKKADWRCTSTFFNLPIYPDGTVYPCDGIDRPMGNVFSEPIHKIYYSHEFKELRKNILINRNTDCKKCVHLCAINGSLNYDFSFFRLMTGAYKGFLKRVSPINRGTNECKTIQI